MSSVFTVSKYVFLFQARVVLKYRHSDGNLCVKVTDDLVVSIHVYLLHTFRFVCHLFEIIRVYGDYPLGCLFCISFKNEEPHSSSYFYRPSGNNLTCFLNALCQVSFTKCCLQTLSNRNVETKLDVRE